MRPMSKESAAEQALDEKVDEEEEVLETAIPGLDAIAVAGNTKKVAVFIFLRIAFFSLSFFVFKGAFVVTLTNPYFLVLCSSVFLAAFHILKWASDRFGLYDKTGDILRSASNDRSPLGLFVDLFGMIAAGLFIFMFVGPLLLFELLLASQNVLFLVLDLTLAAVALIVIERGDPREFGRLLRSFE